jgi:hypothetical protein
MECDKHRYEANGQSLDACTGQRVIRYGLVAGALGAVGTLARNFAPAAGPYAAGAEVAGKLLQVGGAAVALWGLARARAYCMEYVCTSFGVWKVKWVSDMDSIERGGGQGQQQTDPRLGLQMDSKRQPSGIPVWMCIKQ